MNRKFIDLFKIPEGIRIPLLGGMIYRRLVQLDNKSIIKETLLSYPLNKEKRQKKIIVSLTSFPARIEYVYLAIKSLMLQSYKPDRIILWLAEEQFPENKLPQNLRDLCAFGLEIRFCENLYGHKKYFYALQEQKEDELVITYDDDLIYPPDSIKWLVERHNEFPSAIICNRAQALAYEKDGKVKNPGRWDTISNEGTKKLSYKLCPSTGGGCLYPYHVLHNDASDKNLIKELALRGDDLWIMFMANERGTPIIKTRKYHRTFSAISGTQEFQLATGNMINNEYMSMLEKLIEKYPKAWERCINNR